MRYRHILLTCGALAAVVLFAAGSSAGERAASERIGGLTTAGNVWTNDILLPSGSSVRAGDEIRTGDRALGVIEAPALRRLEIRAGSRVRLERGAVALHAGAVASGGLAVDLQDFRISPEADGDNWFVVRREEGEWLVAAYRGGAVIHASGAAPLTVPAGSYALAAGLPQKGQTTGETSSDTADSGQTPSSSGRGAAKAAKKGGWKLGSLASPQGAIIVTGVTAAVVAGVVASGGTRNEAVSPQD